jgi:hypothetical protein
MFCEKIRAREAFASLTRNCGWIWREPIIRQLRARTLRCSCIRCGPDRLSRDREDGVPSQLRSHSLECHNHSLPDAPPVLRDRRTPAPSRRMSFRQFCANKVRGGAPGAACLFRRARCRQTEPPPRVRSHGVCSWFLVKGREGGRGERREGQRMPALLVPQGNHRIDAHGAAGGDIASQQRDEHQ